MAAANNEDNNAIKPNVSVKPFIKQEEPSLLSCPNPQLGALPAVQLGARQPGALHEGPEGYVFIWPLTKFDPKLTGHFCRS